MHPETAGRLRTIDCPKRGSRHIEKAGVKGVSWAPVFTMIKNHHRHPGGRGGRDWGAPALGFSFVQNKGKPLVADPITSLGFVHLSVVSGGERKIYLQLKGEIGSHLPYHLF